MYLTQITGEDKYIRICEADMKVFKRAGGEKNSINVICLEKLGESTWGYMSSSELWNGIALSSLYGGNKKKRLPI